MLPVTNRDWSNIAETDYFSEVIDPDSAIASEYLWGLYPASDSNTIEDTEFTDLNGDTVRKVDELALVWYDGTTRNDYTF